MKKIVHRIIMLFLVLSCTACFDLQENLFLKKDGSGNFAFIIDMSQMKSMMAMFDDMGKAFDDKDNRNDKKKNDKKKKSDDKFGDAFEKTRRKLLNTEGISNVKIIDDSASFHYGISFDFKNIASLNEAMNKLFDEDDSVITDKKPLTYFEFKDNKLTRLEALDSKSILGKSSSLSPQSESENAHALFDPEKLFSTVTYTTNYEFQEKVNSVENEEALLSSNMQKVTLKVLPFASTKDSTQKKQTIGNVISFK